MKAPTTKTKSRAKQKRNPKKIKSPSLSTCPVGGAGWCPYPFSVEQLERRLREKTKEAALVGAGK